MDLPLCVTLTAMRRFEADHQAEIDYTVGQALLEQTINMRLNEQEVGRFERLLRFNLVIEMLVEKGKWN